MLDDLQRKCEPVFWHALIRVDCVALPVHDQRQWIAEFIVGRFVEYITRVAIVTYAYNDVACGTVAQIMYGHLRPVVVVFCFFH